VGGALRKASLFAWLLNGSPLKQPKPNRYTSAIPITSRRSGEEAIVASSRGESDTNPESPETMPHLAPELPSMPHGALLRTGSPLPEDPFSAIRLEHAEQLVACFEDASAVPHVPCHMLGRHSPAIEPR